MEIVVDSSELKNAISTLRKALYKKETGRILCYLNMSGKQGNTYIRLVGCDSHRIHTYYLDTDEELTEKFSVCFPVFKMPKDTGISTKCIIGDTDITFKFPYEDVKLNLIGSEYPDVDRFLKKDSEVDSEILVNAKYLKEALEGFKENTVRIGFTDKSLNAIYIDDGKHHKMANLVMPIMNKSLVYRNQERRRPYSEQEKLISELSNALLMYWIKEQTTEDQYFKDTLQSLTESFTDEKVRELLGRTVWA